ncbi:hypothetical protein AL542_16640 [Grimontia hollisae]|uniref:Uncharacterized protein n=2 Tax=Grimontia hollisae TaxID=673 RepID=D0IAA9_GRIHO|nr:hypothetical protein [Grimontia hollisae]AMG31806.1 hypothetical protein AL542_16640 [Grimontia hollisae]EEY70827.1 hypothetical protein VHA_002686 [Grimontia hollisae CIP 101886]MDF2186235.1 hypothetical protein [Grimontia hollisae]STO44726.1 Uncharacterised protein [Grimontia hollisae]STO57530.1 Uncharacterised protein [Grimontia hollisae]
MSFFVPSAESQEQAESIYQAIAKHIDAPVNDTRIETLTWEHEGQEVVAKVGDKLPDCFGADDEVILAIFDCGDVFKVCTPNRGAVCFDPVVASRPFISSVDFF